MFGINTFTFLVFHKRNSFTWKETPWKIKIPLVYTSYLMWCFLLVGCRFTLPDAVVSVSNLKYTLTDPLVADIDSFSGWSSRPFWRKFFCFNFRFRLFFEQLLTVEKIDCWTFKYFLLRINFWSEITFYLCTHQWKKSNSGIASFSVLIPLDFEICSFVWNAKKL